MLVDTIQVSNDLGENILWDEALECLWWTDITQKKLYCFFWESRELVTYTTPFKLCSFGFVAGEPGLFIAAFERLIALYNPATGDITELYRLPDSFTAMRFNDGRVDVEGRFWVGTMSELSPPESTGVLYCVEKVGNAYRVSEKDEGIAITNGLCWDFSRSRMFLADSAKQQIYTYHYSVDKAEIADKKLFAHTEAGHYPDGAVTDSSGNLWSAQWGGHCVKVYNPEGTLVQTVALPVEQPTCVCFGGPDLNYLIVSSARYGLNPQDILTQPLAGSVFAQKVNESGIPAPRFLK